MNWETHSITISLTLFPSFLYCQIVLVSLVEVGIKAIDGTSDCKSTRELLEDQLVSIYVTATSVSSD